MSNDHAITELTMDDARKAIERISRPYHIEVSIVVPAAGMEEYRKLPDKVKESPQEAWGQMVMKGYLCYLEEHIVYEEEGE